MSWALQQCDVSATPWSLESETVQCIVTSPPYWGLRDYGTAQWEGGRAFCDHKGNPLASAKNKLGDGRGARDHEKVRTFTMPQGQTCSKCGAKRIDRQVGLEPTPTEYVQRLVSIFEEARRVLKPDGVLWLNLGDSFASGTIGRRDTSGEYADRRAEQYGSGRGEGNGPRDFSTRSRPPGLKQKDLVGIPWRVAFALQDAGWYLRSDIIWAKPNPMPESVRDRPTRAHEYVFLFTKSPRYYYDQDAIREPYPEATLERLKQMGFDAQTGGPKDYGEGSNRSARRAVVNLKSRALAPAPQLEDSNGWSPNGANARTVWNIPTEPFPGAHFATFPTELVKRCILAGSRPGDWVLDPFAGSGTAVLVADRLGRNAIGFDLNPAYIEMARRRLEDDAPLFNVEKPPAVVPDSTQMELPE